MKVLKWLGVAVLAIVVLVVAIGFMLPKEWEVTRTREIKATPAQIHAYVADWDKWPTWSPFEKEDPNMEITVDGASTGVGATRSWKSESMGDGTQTITMSDPDKGMEFSLQMPDFPKFYGRIEYAPGSADGTTKVTWTDWGENDSFIGKWFGVMMDGMLGPKFEQGLADLETAIADGK